MEFTKEQLLDAQHRLADRATGHLAPMLMWGGLLLLQGDEDVTAALTQCRMKDDTTWRTLWLTKSRIIYAEATNAHEQWSAYSGIDDGTGEADTLVTWARPFSEVVSLEVDRQRVYKERHYSDHHTWRAGVRLGLRDGLAVPVPLFESEPGYESRDQIEEFIRVLASRTWH